MRYEINKLGEIAVRAFKAASRACLFMSLSAFAACGGASVSNNTAQIVTEASMKQMGTPAEFAAIKATPHYTASIDCIAALLDHSGWSADKHTRLMKMTNDTGDLSKIDQYAHDESELMEVVVPVGAAMQECFK